MELVSNPAQEYYHTSGNGDPWDHLLAHAAPRDHIVHLYQDQDFLNRVVCRFAAAALANGEGVILVPTQAHWDAFRPRLEAEGVDVESAQHRGQLNIVDADELLPRFMQHAMPDGPMFLGLAGEIIARTRVSRALYQRALVGRDGQRPLGARRRRGEHEPGGSLRPGQPEQNVAVFCSFLMDNFNGDVHTRMLPRLGNNHSHLIPVEDYGRLESAVAEALRETVGPDEAVVLQDRLLSQYQAPFQMPPAEALLLALRQTLPTLAEAVLQKSRNLYTARAARR